VVGSCTSSSEVNPEGSFEVRNRKETILTPLLAGIGVLDIAGRMAGLYDVTLLDNMG
jgi:hypothetical protein